MSLFAVLNLVVEVRVWGERRFLRRVPDKRCIFNTTDSVLDEALSDEVVRSSGSVIITIDETDVFEGIEQAPVTHPDTVKCWRYRGGPVKENCEGTVMLVKLYADDALRYAKAVPSRRDIFITDFRNPIDEIADSRDEIVRRAKHLIIDIEQIYGDIVST